MLTPVTGSPFAAGTFPYSVAVSPNGAFAYVANYGNHTVSAYTINTGTGTLTPVPGSPFATETYPYSVTVRSDLVPPPPPPPPLATVAIPTLSPIAYILLALSLIMAVAVQRQRFSR